jgi:hypothetical protein
VSRPVPGTSNEGDIPMSVIPYLQVTDAQKAIDFYVEAFGAV